MSKVKQGKKQVRKPVSDKFTPKRLAINFDPPTLILEYLVVDTGKLYHHKMRLDSILRRENVAQKQVMQYVKTKHHLYFVGGKVNDSQLGRFIDRILLKMGKIKQKEMKEIEKDCFDYLNDDDQYEEDYEDYEEPEKGKSGVGKSGVGKSGGEKSGSTTPFTKGVTPFTKGVTSTTPFAKGTTTSTFMTYPQQNEDEAEWDLDMDENADFI